MANDMTKTASERETGRDKEGATAHKRENKGSLVLVVNTAS